MATKKTFSRTLAALAVLPASLAWSVPMPGTARAVIPRDVRQIVCVDYRTAKDFWSATALKAQALPENLRSFEMALKSIGVNPDRDLETFTFASFDGPKDTYSMVGIATGAFSSNTVLTQLAMLKIRPLKNGNTQVYPISKTMTVTLLNERTVLLGDDAAIRKALSVLDKQLEGVEANQELAKTIKSIEKATVWSVLDGTSTRKMVATAMGDLSKLSEFASIRDRVDGSYYTMNFRGGVRFHMDVLTANDATAAKLSQLLKAGVLYKKLSASPAQVDALSSVQVKSRRVSQDSERSDLRIRFDVDQPRFQVLADLHCFTAMVNERKEWSGLTSANVADDPSAESTATPK